MSVLSPTAHQRGKINREQWRLSNSPRSTQAPAPDWYMYFSMSVYIHVYGGIWNMGEGVCVRVRALLDRDDMTKMADRADSRSSHPPHDWSPLLWHCCPHKPHESPGGQSGGRLGVVCNGLIYDAHIFSQWFRSVYSYCEQKCDYFTHWSTKPWSNWVQFPKLHFMHAWWVRRNTLHTGALSLHRPEAQSLCVNNCDASGSETCDPECANQCVQMIWECHSSTLVSVN